MSQANSQEHFNSFRIYWFDAVLHEKLVAESATDIEFSNTWRYAYFDDHGKGYAGNGWAWIKRGEDKIYLLELD